jgi:hypothetical protein
MATLYPTYVPRTEDCAQKLDCQLGNECDRAPCQPFRSSARIWTAPLVTVSVRVQPAHGARSRHDSPTEPNPDVEPKPPQLCLRSANVLSPSVQLVETTDDNPSRARPRGRGGRCAGAGTGRGRVRKCRSPSSSTGEATGRNQSSSPDIHPPLGEFHTPSTRRSPRATGTAERVQAPARRMAEQRWQEHVARDPPRPRRLQQG